MKVPKALVLLALAGLLVWGTAVSDEPVRIGVVDIDQATLQDFLAGDTGSAELEHSEGWFTINRDKATIFDAIDSVTVDAVAETDIVMPEEFRFTNTDAEETAQWLDLNRNGPFVYQKWGGAGKPSDFDVWCYIEHDSDEDLHVGILMQSIDTPGRWASASLAENGPCQGAS